MGPTCSVGPRWARCWPWPCYLGMVRYVANTQSAGRFLEILGMLNDMIRSHVASWHLKPSITGLFNQQHDQWRKYQGSALLWRDQNNRPVMSKAGTRQIANWLVENENQRPSYQYAISILISTVFFVRLSNTSLCINANSRRLLDRIVTKTLFWNPPMKRDRFNIKHYLLMYRYSHRGDKTFERPSDLLIFIFILARSYVPLEFPSKILWWNGKY